MNAIHSPITVIKYLNHASISNWPSEAIHEPINNVIFKPMVWKSMVYESMNVQLFFFQMLGARRIWQIREIWGTIWVGAPV